MIKDIDEYWRTQNESKYVGPATSLNCWTPPEGADGADGAAAGVGCGLGGDDVGAELSPVSTSMRTEPTLTVSCTCPNMHG